MKDNLGASIGKTLAHEMGHFLGIAGDYDKPEQLMHKSNQPSAKRVIHSEVDFAKPDD